MTADSDANPCSPKEPKSGFWLQTRTFHSLRPRVPLPPLSQSLSITDYILSLLLQSSTSTSNTTVLIDSSTDRQVSDDEFLSQIQSLSSSLRRSTSLSKGHVAFILAPPSLHIPVLYFALLALGVTISPANPLGSDLEISHQVRLSNPVIAFATSSTSHKLPRLPLGTVLLDSPEFLSMIDDENRPNADPVEPVHVSQSDSAAILYSSGTTGLVKGVLLTHRNMIALFAGLFGHRLESDRNEAQKKKEPQQVSLITVPLFHVFGFFKLMRAVAMGETLVLMGRFDLEVMLKAVEKYKVTHLPASPPLLVALTKSELVKKYDLSSLRLLACSGAPLGKDVALRFVAKFPNVEIAQGYGLTESGGGGASMEGSEEYSRLYSVGRLTVNMEAKIVDPVTGEALPPGQKGELWLRGPTIMKGYIGDDKATVEILDSEGWLKTGDLCYFDSDGFLSVVDRLKELIKYKAYQVAPAELEHLLLSHPEIADAAVIPYPDEAAGQIPMAFVVRKAGSNITEAQVIEFIAKKEGTTGVFVGVLT
ncbi:4-coumarate--CoA ligase-like 9 [Morella rubra]|uniref:4-coumarate--CoA ligase-like 9 n=1 Tax=Morella rubra TaxID=262757 RepID=A0A6A1VZL8_9ROSI|nr:4-coumarate--CoA ligase-like 9 [Morella rubra]